MVVRCRRSYDSTWLFVVRHDVEGLFVTVPLPVLDLFLDFVDGILPGTERIVYDRVIKKLSGSARSTIN